MTDEKIKPTEQKEDEPEVEGHHFRGPERTSGPEEVGRTGLTDDDEGPEVEGHHFRGPERTSGPERTQ